MSAIRERQIGVAFKTFSKRARGHIMAIFFLVSAAAISIAGVSSLRGAAPYWGSDVKEPGQSRSAYSDTFTKSPAPFDVRLALADCVQDLSPHFGCGAAGRFDDVPQVNEPARGDRVPEISQADNEPRPFAQVTAAATLLLSALAGLVFAGRGLRNR